MHFSMKSGFSAAVTMLVLLLLNALAVSATQDYCSSQNTGSGNAKGLYNYQSNGYCTDQCKADYAIAIVQGKYCWCSDYAPSDQTDTSDCSTNCPGFPDEQCGNTDDDLFGYILYGQPKGTQGGISKSTSVTSDAPSTTLEPSTSVTEKVRTSTDDSGKTVIQTVKETVILTPTFAATSAPTSSEIPFEDTTSKKSNAGAIAGGVVGGVALLSIVGGVIFLLRRRQRKNAEKGKFGVQRNTSTMSKSGLLRTENPLTATNGTHNIDNIAANSASERRNSRLDGLDPRLNPTAMLGLDNTSRASFVSLDDSRDYGRVLGVRNPDPDPEAK